MIIFRNPKCAACGKVITRKFFTPAASFDLYHPECYEEAAITLMYIDEIKEMPPKLYEKIRSELNKPTPCLRPVCTISTQPSKNSWVRRRFLEKP